MSSANAGKNVKKYYYSHLYYANFNPLSLRLVILTFFKVPRLYCDCAMGTEPCFFRFFTAPPSFPSHSPLLSNMHEETSVGQGRCLLHFIRKIRAYSAGGLFYDIFLLLPMIYFFHCIFS